MKLKVIKKSSVHGSVVLLVVAVSFVLYAFQSGITGRTLKGPEPGCTCHSENPSSNVSVIINGPDVLNMGETADYSVVITGGVLTRGGTNIAVSNGSLNAGTGMQKVSGELTHTAPKAPQNSMVVFEFTYTAPETPGTVTMYANGNSVNFNGQPLGDAWNFAESKMITVSDVSDVGEELQVKDFYLLQNYPNPFNPSTKISFKISDAGLIKLAIYNSLGNEVKTIVDEYKSAGSYTYSFNAENLSSGVYFYKLISDNFIETKKMLLIK